MILSRQPGLAVLYKPAGMSLLADRSGARCLWNDLPDLLGAKPLLVHRLDKGTSGVLLVATTPEAQRRLTRAFAARQVRKYYLAWVVGRVGGGRTLTVNLPLRKGRKSRYRVAGQRGDIVCREGGWHLPLPEAAGRESLTRIRRLQQTADLTLLLAAPVTGRTHQLRVHLAWIGHPILGDHLYGRPHAPEQQAPRLALHCHRLVVPGVGTFRAPAEALRALGQRERSII